MNKRKQVIVEILKRGESEYKSRMLPQERWKTLQSKNISGLMIKENNDDELRWALKPMGMGQDRVRLYACIRRGSIRET